MSNVYFQKMLHVNISLMTAIEKAIQMKAQNISFTGNEWNIGKKIPHNATKQRNCIAYIFARIIHALRMVFCSGTYGKQFKKTVNKFEEAYSLYEQGLKIGKLLPFDKKKPVVTEIVPPSVIREEEQIAQPKEAKKAPVRLADTFSRAGGKLARSLIHPKKTSGSSQTTNPVYFISTSGTASKQPTAAIAGVMKSRFSAEFSFTQKVRDIVKDIHKNASIEKIRESLKKHIPELYNGFIKDEPASIENIFFDLFAKPSEINSNIPKIVQTLENIRDRYIHTALFAVEFDQLCQTNLTPASCAKEMRMLIKTSREEKEIFVRGVFQSGIHFIPLNKGTEGKNDDYKELQTMFEIFDPFIDIESYQQAVIRTTELADADLHAGNVALVPKMGEKVLSGITKLSSKQLRLFLHSLKEFSTNPQEFPSFIQILKNQLGAEQTNFFEKIMGDKNPNDAAIAAQWEAMTSKEGLRFEIKLFDVDLTMPQTNDKNVRGVAPLVRNILLALPQADHPLTKKIRAELRLRRNFQELIIQHAEKRFNPQTAQALRERMDKLIAAAEETVMTPKGLVWRAIPLYARFDAAWDAMGEDDTRAEKYDSIGTVLTSELLTLLPHVLDPTEIPLSKREE